MVTTLCNTCDSTEAFELTRHIVLIFEAKERGIELLNYQVDYEIKGTENGTKLFQGNNSFAFLMFGHFVKITGINYLRTVIGRTVNEIYSYPKNLEIDPSRILAGETHDGNLKNLISTVQIIIDTLTSTIDKCPVKLRRFFSHLCEILDKKFPEQKHSSVAIFTLLGFLCPSIVSPLSYSLVPSAPSKEAQRALAVVSKTLQHVAMGINFNDPLKELNTLIEKNAKKLPAYYDKLSEIPLDTNQYSANTNITIAQKEFDESVQAIKIFLDNNVDKISQEFT